MECWIAPPPLLTVPLFKLMLAALCSLLSRSFTSSFNLPSTSSVALATQLLVQQMGIIETMTPLDFLQFR